MPEVYIAGKFHKPEFCVLERGESPCYDSITKDLFSQVILPEKS